ncbi:peroxiredoxin-like family protein [Halobacteriovorax sp. HLS]|uniref:peroxiredoxin-like family protein n=1 Tax=Halobacteriovorax sp. HLS TaxID=2234000 RepID=UPI000FDB11CA|nr:redoxin domain-containing protein [Halobacteriovorax sp. HLS]
MKFLVSLFFLVSLISCASSSTGSKLPSSAMEISPLINGAKLPSMMVSNHKGKVVDLSTELKGKKSVVVFYRGGWCPYCNVQLQGLRKIEKKLKKLGWQIVGISPDSVSSISQSINKHNLGYKLYSDSLVNAAKGFGLAYKVDDKTNTKLLGYGINLEEASGQKHRALPVPAVYLIGEDGSVLFNYVNPNYKVRLKESIILEAAKELK